MASGKAFSYNYERYSARDLIEYVTSELGLKTEYFDRRPSGGGNGFLISGTSIHIRVPDVGYIQKLNFNPSLKFLADVWWDTYSPLYTNQPKGELLRVEHEKIFNKLKRKFQMRKDETPQAIKDLAWVTRL